MRIRTLASVFAAVVGVTGYSSSAWANLVLTHNGSATISSLSSQLLDHPRSSAGRMKTVWDADPPEPAVQGTQFFLYNMNANGTAEADNFAAKSFTVTGISPGPGYRIDSANILLRGQGNNQGNFFTGVSPSTTYDDPTNPAAVGNDFSNYIELGLVEVKFTLIDPAAAGLIGANDDSAEQAYAGASTRGDEHFRIFTETRAGHDDDTPRAAMTTLVPTDFVFRTQFDTGYLDFGNGDVSTGSNVTGAAINTVLPDANTATSPEPASLATLGLVALTGLRRQRR